MTKQELDVCVDAMKAAMLTEMAKMGKNRSFEDEGEIMWHLIRRFTNKEDSPYLKILDFSAMLSPLGDEISELTIPSWAWLNVKFRAQQIMDYTKEKDYKLAPMVKAHLEKILNDEIPYGYRVLNEDEETNIKYTGNRISPDTPGINA